MLIVQGNLHPYVFKRIWNLAEQTVNRFETICQNLVNAILDGVTVAKISDPDFTAGLPNPLDTALTLLEPSRVPGKVDIDERPEALQVQSLGGSVSAEQQHEVATADTGLENIPVATLKSAFAPKTRPIATCVETYINMSEFFELRHFIPDPSNGVVILREKDAAEIEPTARNSRMGSAKIAN